MIIQVTIGCAHNKCTFCSMFKDKKFRIRKIEEVLDDLNSARRHYRHVEKIFLADGDALVLKNKDLIVILEHIKKVFPECQRVSIYGSPQDVLRKSHQELVELKENGIGIIYIGAESGSDKVLKNIVKGATRAELIQSVQMIETSGIMASVTFISGLGGDQDWQEHAIESGTMISQMEPSYVGLLTLLVEPNAELYEDIRSGKFIQLSPVNVLKETQLMLENINVSKKCVFRSNHASNYVSLKGDLPMDREKLINQLKVAIEKGDSLKDDRFRML